MSANITAVTNQSSTTDGATALAGIKTALTNVVTDVDLKAPLISPSFTTPTLGVATATSINKVAITAPATGSTLTIDDGFTLHATGNVTALSGSHTGTSSGTNTGDQTISDATISTTDITTNNVSTSKHGFAPKAPNDATKYLDGTGAYSTPASGVGSYVGAVTTVTSSTTSNQDTTFTPGFTAKGITIYYKMDGTNNGTAQYTIGYSSFSGTTITGSFYLQKSTAVATTAFNYANTVVDNSSPTVGGTTGANYGQGVISVINITSTQFTVRFATTNANTFPANATYYVVATV